MLHGETVKPLKAVGQIAEPPAGKDSFLFRPVEFIERTFDKPMHRVFCVVGLSKMISVLFRTEIIGI